MKLRSKKFFFHPSLDVKSCSEKIIKKRTECKRENASVLFIFPKNGLIIKGIKQLSIVAKYGQKKRPPFSRMSLHVIELAELVHFLTHI